MIGDGGRVIHLEETGSTNADAMRLALNGETLPLWVDAARQTAGKGRAGRIWVSERGNLHASLAMQCGAPLEKAGELALVAGVAAIRAIKASSSLADRPSLRLKWPNDILIGTAKVGGILVETTKARGEPGFVAVLGFGLNVASKPDGLDRNATALSLHDASADGAAIFGALREETTRALDIWQSGQRFGDIRELWIENAGPIGERITVHAQSGLLEGTYQGLSASGALLARIGDNIQEIQYGDVSLVGGAGEGSQA